jgi:nucleoside triphosphate pyrophosphatase
MTQFVPVSDKPCITLASASPRRRELLDQIQVSYNVLPVNIDESHHAGESAEQFVTRLALEKARAGYKLSPQLPSLGSDTIVIFKQQILGKPENRQQGLEMLSLLAGKVHQVMTAVAVCYGDTVHCRVSQSEVEFTQLNWQQIEAYWETGEATDKAGGYGIQGIAGQFIKKITGSYSGIMGLPLFETTELLKLAGIKVL